MRLYVASPYTADSLSGNTVSARRIVKLLAGTAVHAEVLDGEVTAPIADGLIALHAKKSAVIIKWFRKENPQARIVLYLTGTDLYRDIPNGCEVCEESLSIADTIVVTSCAAVNSVPLRWQEKTIVVRKSIDLPNEITPSLKVNKDTPPLFTIVSHLRKVKNPFLVAEALKLTPEFDANALILGRVIDPAFETKIKKHLDDEARLQWKAGCPHLEALSWMQRSIATINSSLLEGGANSVGESIMLGSPVLATRIEGNIGMLGENYDGYFESENPDELAALMQRICEEPEFLNHLTSQIQSRQSHFSAENERADWLKALGISEH